MNLASWKKLHNHSNITLAKFLGVSLTTVYNIISRRYLPSDLLISHIEKKTDGAVKRRDYNLPPEKNCPICGKKISNRKKEAKI
jgi:hypothetical protein